jgi:ATP-dependent RNA helicase DeaD
MDIAAAAAKLAAEATLGEEADNKGDIPQFEEKAESRPSRRTRADEAPSRRDRQRDEPVYPQKKSGRESKGQGKQNHPVSPWESGSTQQRTSGHRPPKRRTDAMTRLVVKVGDQRNVRPKDLVGAIANEANIAGDAIGAIQIGDESCLVEVPESVVDKVLRALSRTTIKGQRVTARRERER